MNPTARKRARYITLAGQIVSTKVPGRDGFSYLNVENCDVFHSARALTSDGARNCRSAGADLDRDPLRST